MASHFMCKILIYIITQVILAWRLVLAYDLLEDRRMIDIIRLQSFSPCFFKMAGSFENLDNILRDWAKDKVHKSLAEALNRFEKFLLENYSEKILKQAQCAVEWD